MADINLTINTSPINLSVVSGRESLSNGDRGDIVVSGDGATWTIDANVVSNSKLATMATSRLKGRVSSGTGSVEDLTPIEVTDLLNIFVGDSGSGGTKGLVPAPSSGDAAANKYLKADGTWATVSGSGGTPGGADTQVQFNDGGAFAGDSQLTFNKVSGLLNITGAGTSGVALLKTNPGSGASYFQVNDNGTVVINSDSGTGAFPLRVLYNGIEQFSFSYLGILSPRAGGGVNIGAGLMSLTDSSGIAMINTFNELHVRPGALGGTGTRSFSVISQDSGQIPFIVRAATSQTALLIDVRDSSANSLFSIRSNGALKPASLDDSSAANDSIYYSTTSSKLVYKDSGGVVNALY